MIRIGRKRDQRDLLVRNLTTSVILYESVITSPAKARMVQGVVDRVITIAKSEDKLTARRRLMAFLTDEKAVQKVMDELTTRLSDRNSGYTRRLRLQSRSGDGGEQVLVQLVNTVLLDKPKETAKKAAAQTETQTEDHNHDHESGESHA